MIPPDRAGCAGRYLNTVGTEWKGRPKGDYERAPDLRKRSISAIALCSAACRATVGDGWNRKAAYLGGTMEYTLDTPIGELFAVSQTVEAPFTQVDTVAVTLTSNGVVVVPPEP